VGELVRLNGVVLKRGAQEVLRGVSLTLHSGEKVGLVGRNGAGKTTLLSLIAGSAAPTEGRVLRAPGLRVGYVEQGTSAWRGTLWAVAAAGLAYVRELEAALRAAETRLDGPEGLEHYAALTALFEGAGGYEAEATLRTHLGRLGFSEADDDRDVTTLSGGERARLGLARALAERPDLLLLDEPSSYLDLPTKGWLAEALAGFPGALLLASHDRALLDAVSRRTLHLGGGTVTSYRGGYTRFQAQAGHAAARGLREADRAAHERHTLAARARAQPTLSARRSLERRLARLPDVPRVAAARETPLTLSAPPVRPNSLLLDARHLSLTRGGRPLLRDAFLRVSAGDKLAVVGPNGGGKTSLLRLLAGNLESEHPEASVQLSRGVRLAVYDQHSRGLSDGVSLGEQLGRSVSEPRARLLLALVGLEGAFDKAPETLSGGERARAGIARLMASDANLLLLDEPSESLDIETVEKLEVALRDTAAALVLVSHDAALVDAVATRVLGLDGGELNEYRGGLAGFYAGTLRLEPDLPGAASSHATVPGAPQPERDHEAELVALEDETTAVEARLADPVGLSGRDRARLERRLAELVEARSERYDARLPAPLPRYRAVEGGLAVTTDGVITGGTSRPVVFSTDTGWALHLFVDDATRIGHLLLLDPPGRCLLPWAERASVRGAARIAFEGLGVRALQLQRDTDLGDAGFEAAGDGWWVLDRDRYARLEGLLRPEGSRPGVNPRAHRQLRHPQSWAGWAARRRRARGRKPVS